MSETLSPAPMAGLHHITAIASDAQRNLDFYVGLLGQRLVKQTVNFDAPQVYHFYFADGAGSPGTVLTFFPWANARAGRRGAGETAAVAYNVVQGTLSFWRERFERAGVPLVADESRFGEPLIAVLDPDGMRIELVEALGAPAIAQWEKGPIPGEFALRGFHSATLQVRDAEASAVLLRESFGWVQVEQEGNRTRYSIDGDIPGRIIDLLETPDAANSVEGAGSVHHIAFRTPDDATEAMWRETLLAERFDVTPVRDRSYFHSIYFREPNGILYEIATDIPGFATDESVDELGTSLMLPEWFEARRAEIVSRLAPITLP